MKRTYKKEKETILIGFEDEILILVPDLSLDQAREYLVEHNYCDVGCADKYKSSIQVWAHFGFVFDGEETRQGWTTRKEKPETKGWIKATILEE
jgi:hypothetical protein